MILQYESVIVICFLSALIALFLGMLCRSFKSIGPFYFLLCRRGAAPFIGGGDSVDAVWGADSLLQKIQRMAIEALLLSFRVSWWWESVPGKGNWVREKYGLGKEVWPRHSSELSSPLEV